MKVRSHHPPAGQGRRWTLKELQSIPDDWVGHRICDGAGLWATVRKTTKGISLDFRFDFRGPDGRKRRHYCGSWPGKALTEIRAARDLVRASLQEGHVPLSPRARLRQALDSSIEERRRHEEVNQSKAWTLLDLFEAWLLDGVNRKDGNAELRRNLGKHVMGKLGSSRIDSLVEAHFLSIYKSMVKRGNNRLAITTHKDIKQMFAWATPRPPWRALITQGDPVALINIQRVVAADYDGIRTRVLQDQEIKVLHTRFMESRRRYEELPSGSRYGCVRPVPLPTELAVWICLSTACRIGELCKSRWSEVDVATGVWTIPKSNVKGRQRSRQTHTVYLSPFALAQFKRLHALTGHSTWCFPSSEADRPLLGTVLSKQVGDRQWGLEMGPRKKNRVQSDCLRVSAGEDGRWTFHDLRRTAATVMQRLGVPLDVIDRCQNHILAGSTTRRHYLHHTYETETKQAWAKLGQWIEAQIGGVP